MARYIAKNVVAAGLGDRAMVQLAYAIGVADPVSVLVDTEGTGRVRREDRRARARAVQADTARHHGVAGPAPADLPQDGGLRALRPHGAGIHLGTHGQGCGRCAPAPDCSRTIQVPAVRRILIFIVLATAVVMAAVAVFVFATLPPRAVRPAAPGDRSRLAVGAWHVHSSRFGRQRFD
jgi:hypothetical protein